MALTLEGLLGQRILRLQKNVWESSVPRGCRRGEFFSVKKKPSAPFRSLCAGVFSGCAARTDYV